LIEGAERRSVRVAIVSNNSEKAVQAFLRRFSWAAPIHVLAGVRVVGLSKTPERGRNLIMAGAVALIERSA
jgi:1-acyl-sn-glycerol-3-phosphate acyltransferase